MSTNAVSEARIAFAGWGALVLRLWRNSRNLEVEWTVGPVPIDDGVGKEVTDRHKLAVRCVEPLYINCGIEN